MNVPRKMNGLLIPRPLFRVELEPHERNPEIYNLTYLLQVQIKVQSAKPKTDPPLCRNCQRIGYTKRYCLRAPRCIKCGENYESDKCVLDLAVPCKCANCGGPHPANYRGYSTFQELRKTAHKVVDIIRKRRSGVENPSPHLPTFLPPPSPAPLTTQLSQSYASVTCSSVPPPPGLDHCINSSSAPVQSITSAWLISKSYCGMQIASSLGSWS